MYKHILVPVLFGDDRDAEGAINVATHLADDGTRITLLHVIEQIPSYAQAFLPDEILVDRRKEIEAELGLMASKMPNGVAAVALGHPSRAILDWVSAHDVDCVVIASHQPGMQDLLLGSTAAKVVRHAGCAVHVLR